MSHLFLKQFKSPLAYFVAFSIVMFLSMLVESYAYVAAKQIQINADILISGEIRTNNLCIGGACKTAWPKEILSTDIVAGGGVKVWTTSTACNQPSGNFYYPDRCDAYWTYYYSTYANATWYDPRGVLSVSYSQASMPCRETPNGSWNPCGPPRTYPTSPSFSCSGGFVAYTGSPAASIFKDSCDRQCMSCPQWVCSCAGSAVCGLYATPYATPPPYSSPSDE